MRRFFGVLLLLAIISSCNKKQTGYKVYDEYTSYQILELGDGITPQNKEVLQLSIQVESLNGDTLHYVPEYVYHIPIKNHYLDTIWQQFEIGDRIRLKVAKKKLEGYLNFYHLGEYNGKEVIVDVKLLASTSKSEADQLLKEQLSKREIKELANVKQYLKSSSTKFEERRGIYRYQEKTTSGEPIKYGSQVSIHYKGKFLNGYVFDDTYKKELTPSFTFGQEYQLLEGIYTGITGMREGETVKLILPSRHAFGGSGSLAAIVPPYTAVIYEVNIVKVIN